MKRWLTTLGLVLSLTTASFVLSPPAEAVYQLDYGDNISVLVKDFPQYSYTGPIRPDGMIAIPFVGEVEVAGLTTSQVGSRMTRLIEHFVRDPQVTVTITQLRMRSVMVLGQVVHPGRVDINRPHVTVLDAIGASGGFTPRAVRNQVILLHGEGANAQHYVIDVDKMLRTADLSDNMELQADDRIEVPEVWYPDFAAIASSIAPVISLVTSAAVLFALYNQASGGTK